MTTTIAILKAARDLIAKPENWTQGAYAKRSDGRETLPSDPDAVCFCSVGAIFKAGSSEFGFSEIMPKEIRDAFGVGRENHLVRLNDGSTHSEVLDLFSKAISSAEEKQGTAS